MPHADNTAARPWLTTTRMDSHQEVSHPLSPSSSCGYAPIRLTTVDQTGSTQTDLHHMLTGADGALDMSQIDQWPHLSALRARYQTAGRGRGTHTWTTPPDSSVLVSTVLRPTVCPDVLPWIPILAGHAVRDTIEQVLHSAAGPVHDRVMTKWPNDVVIVPPDDCEHDRQSIPGWGCDRKIAGILTDVFFPATPGWQHRQEWKRRRGACLVVGIGINVTQTADELPVPWATSLRLMGAHVTTDDVCELLCHHLASRIAFLEHHADEFRRENSGIRQEIHDCCRTLGKEIQVTTPAGIVMGRACAITPALMVHTEDGFIHVNAGDVAYVRQVGEEEPAPLL